MSGRTAGDHEHGLRQGSGSRLRAPRLLLCLTACLVSVSGGNALAGFSRGGSFTASGYGVRAWGMGGAAVAWSTDESAVYWNPALLGTLEGDRLGLSYVNLVPGTDARQSYAAYARILVEGPADHPTRTYAQHAVGAIYGNLLLELSDGQSYNENSLRLAYAFSPDYFVSIGLALNPFLSNGPLKNFDSKGSAVDVGVRLSLLERLSLGFVVRNAASRIMFDDGRDESLQRFVTVASAYTVTERLLVEGDIIGAYGGLERFVIGAESMQFSSALALRAGASFVNAGENRIIPHFGVGIRIGHVSVDYNANLDEDTAFEDTHRFSLGIGL